MLRSKIVVLILCAATASQTGCITLSALMGQKRSPTIDTSMLEAQGYSVPPGGMPSPISPNAGSGPRVVLEVRADERHLESIPLPTDRGVFVEELVQQAGLHEKLGFMSISIMRPNGPGSPPIRLDTKIDGKGKAVSVGRNYALLPGDHLIVVSDQRSSFERFIDKHFGD